MKTKTANIKELICLLMCFSEFLQLQHVNGLKRVNSLMPLDFVFLQLNPIASNSDSEHVSYLHYCVCWRAAKNTSTFPLANA